MGGIDDDCGCQVAFEGDLRLADADDRRRRAAQDVNPTPLRQAVGPQLLPAAGGRSRPAPQAGVPTRRDVGQGRRGHLRSRLAATEEALERPPDGRLLGLNPRVPAGRAARQTALGSGGAGRACGGGPPVDRGSAHGAGHRIGHAVHPAAVRVMRTIPPMRNASGNTRATIARAVRGPRSRAIIITAAMHGMKIVIVTIATTT